MPAELAPAERVFRFSRFFFPVEVMVLFWHKKDAVALVSLCAENRLTPVGQKPEIVR